ncbi:uncharacterized protein LOC130743916 [Lotus japonicus]|uniref:uncharacterized protein LOC130743916 n=1 Tax=Lotus japonicus TaxID=34305 RepID=UPI00258BB586|nr:uncharacterized protein LOC130743916 [Lotus japonicus]
MGKSVEVYIDDIIVKTPKGGDHTADLAVVFEQLKKHNMRLNPDKCTFGVRSGKFLGYMLTNRGIELNPDKCQAIMNMKSPRTVKEVQQLAGRMAAIGRFLPKAALRALPLYTLLKKGATFEWSAEADAAFTQLKETFSSPSILTSPKPGETLYLYLAVREKAVSSVLIREEEGRQLPVYFVSRSLKGAELRYKMLEKVALTLLTTARQLRRYFQAHRIVVRTDQPVRQVLHKPDLAGRMVSWSIELSEHDIRYEPRRAIKAQVLADFLVELTDEEEPPAETTWVVNVDGSSNKEGGGAGIVLQSSTGMVVEQSLRFNFPTTNNQAEYEACIAELVTARDLGAKEILVCCDSLLVVSQANGEAQAKDPIMEQYLAHLKRLASTFTKVEFRHVPRAQNDRADTLAKLASTGKPGLNGTVIQGTLAIPYVADRDRPAGQAMMPIGTEKDWRTPIIKYLKSGWLPDEKAEAKKLVRCASWYTVANDDLFKRGFSTPLLKCLTKDRAAYVLAEIHEGSCGHHPGGRSLARKVLRAGYYWPTLEKDAVEHVKQCDPCQRHADLHSAPPAYLSSLVSPWPFHQWGMDLLGPFDTAPGQLKYLVVAVDYYTKWIEAEPLATITTARVQRFFYKNVISRFGVPGVLVTDNGTQFTSKGFRDLLDGLHIKQRFTSVEHPQTNGQAESANRVILRGLRKRLGSAKGDWAEQLDHVLWAYRTTPHSTTGESPYRLTFGTEAVIPAEIGEPSARTAGFDPNQNDQLIGEDLDLLAERRAVANCRELIAKQQAAIRYNRKAVLRSFTAGDLVLRKASVGARSTERGKLAANWEGPYRVVEATGTGAYKLETLVGKEIPRTWNAANLRRYYS